MTATAELAALADDLDRRFAGLDLPGRLAALAEAVPEGLVFTTSFGLEDQVLTDAIVAAGVPIAFATLDTGRLFPETYALWAETERHWGIRVRGRVPAAGAVEDLIAADGIDGFLRSRQARHACCGVRKLEPLGRALAGARGWVTGLRADQSEARAAVAFVGVDAARGLLKANPLADWSRAAIVDHAARRAVPINPLHARGFLSIGCAPCTRAVAPGEPERAGRWWWESDEARECGLHVDGAGRLVRGGAPTQNPPHEGATP
jgi:phosphoadenosine phosphosulfate reductase